jgi:hypothetical protein
MRLSGGLPGKHRKDKVLTESVKGEHALGKRAGNWIKQKYPDWALEPLEKLMNEARAFHASVTLPFDAGIGILPAPLVMTYADKMRGFASRFEALRDSHFRAKYPEMVEWARVEHNGTFDASDYPPIEEVIEAFYFKTEPLPVPDAAHFEGTMKSLLGLDAESVNVRVQDAMVEAQKELMRRLIGPVRAMAEKLSEAPKPKSGAAWKEGDDRPPIFRDTLVGNLKEIASLGPKLNIAGDATIDAFCKEIESLTVIEPDTLRKSAVCRSEVAAKAKAIADRMAAYQL